MANCNNGCKSNIILMFKDDRKSFWQLLNNFKGKVIKIGIETQIKTNIDCIVDEFAIYISLHPISTDQMMHKIFLFSNMFPVSCQLKKKMICGIIKLNFTV